jgi:curved DNA-binding protein CbpA
MDVRGYLRLFEIKDISKVTEDALKRKYRFLCLRFHPDQGGKPEQFRYVHAAYEYLLAEHQKVGKKNQGIRYTVTDDKKFYHYGDGSIFDIEKNRWKRYKKFGMWVIWNYKYIEYLR